MDRRTFLASSASLSVTTSSSTASAFDPLVGMFTQWEKTKRQWFSLIPEYPNFDDPEMLVLEERESKLFQQMIVTKAQTLEGLRCQIALLWEECGPDFIAGSEGSDRERSDPALRLKAQILLGVEGLSLAPLWQSINPKMLPASQF